MIISSTTLAALDRALPQLEQRVGAAMTGGIPNDDLRNIGPKSIYRAPSTVSPDIVDTLYRMLPRDWQERIATPLPPEADRSRAFARIIGFLRVKHPSVNFDLIEALFERFPQ